MQQSETMRPDTRWNAAGAKIEERIIMRQTRHRSVQVVRRYIRDDELFTRNLAAEVGL